MFIVISARWLFTHNPTTTYNMELELPFAQLNDVELHDAVVTSDTQKPDLVYDYDLRDSTLYIRVLGSIQESDSESDSCSGECSAFDENGEYIEDKDSDASRSDSDDTNDSSSFSDESEESLMTVLGLGAESDDSDDGWSEYNDEDWRPTRKNLWMFENPDPFLV